MSLCTPVDTELSLCEYTLTETEQEEPPQFIKVNSLLLKSNVTVKSRMLWLACSLMMLTEPARGSGLGKWSREMSSRLGGLGTAGAEMCVHDGARLSPEPSVRSRLPCSSELCGPAQASSFSSPGPLSVEWRRQRPLSGLL